MGRGNNRRFDYSFGFLYYKEIAVSINNQPDDVSWSVSNMNML
jgi:hypothetical protein